MTVRVEYGLDEAELQIGKFYYLTGIDDPTIGLGKFGQKGALYLLIGNLGPKLYQKLDDGQTINWALYTIGGGATVNPQKYTVVLQAADIINGYINLPQTALANSINAAFDRLSVTETIDYTVSIVGGVTRITFTGDFGAGGLAPLIAGNRLTFEYLI